MGVTGSEESQINNNRFLPLNSIELYHFGEVQRFYDQTTKQQVIKAVYQFVLEPDTESFFINKLKLCNNKCSSLINIVKIQAKTGIFCARGTAYHVYFQYLPTTLSMILAQQTQPLPQEEIRLLVSCLLQAVAGINERETYHGDIYPEFIYLDDRGIKKYKIFDSAYFNPMKHGYYRALEEASFCSPQILANLSERKSFPLYNHFISDTFSIGMVALYGMTLINPIAAYKQKSKQIDYYYIQMLLRIAAQYNYSQYLLNCIAACVQLKNRPTVAEVMQMYGQLRGSPGNLKLSLRRSTYGQ